MRPLHVLVTHRDPVRGEELARMLRQAEYRVVVVHNAGAAADAMNAGPDALFLDLSLPGLDVAALHRALGSISNSEPDSLEAVERRHVAQVLQHTAGNKRRAAHILGISRSTLLHKVRKYRLESAGSPGQGSNVPPG